MNHQKLINLIESYEHSGRKQTSLGTIYINGKNKLKETGSKTYYNLMIKMFKDQCQDNKKLLVTEFGQSFVSDMMSLCLFGKSIN